VELHVVLRRLADRRRALVQPEFHAESVALATVNGSQLSSKVLAFTSGVTCASAGLCSM